MNLNAIIYAVINDTTDHDLKQIIWKVRPRAVILIEDIDTIAASNCRVFVMTTNHIEKIDPALTRPGRIELSVIMGLMTDEMFVDAFYRFFPGFNVPVDVQWKKSLTPAEFQRLLLEYSHDPDAILKSCRSS